MKRTIAVYIGAVCAGLSVQAVPAAAETPVAVVEEVHGKVTGAEFMDYVTPKTVIKLGATGAIVISYLNSCRREKIDGIGTVIVGTDESIVHLANITGEKTDCDAAHSHATTRETAEVAATVVRSVGANESTAKPQLTLYGASPLIEARGRGILTIERLDVSGERQQFNLDGNQLKGRFFDFASVNKSLSPGGIYAAKFGTSKIVFQVDSRAKSGPTPIVGRLVRM
jgi:hypothetical protein